MEITRIGVTAEGGSRFEDVAIDLTDASEISRLSALYPALLPVLAEAAAGPSEEPQS